MSSTRTFIIPMQAPAGTAYGTRRNPWRPKYLQELGLGFTNSTCIRGPGGYYLAEVFGPEDRIEELAAKPDVVELPDTNAIIPEAKLECLHGTCGADLPRLRKPTGRHLAKALRARMLARQAEDRRKLELAAKVLGGARRAGANG